MVLAFSGDAFLASRAARRAVKARGFSADTLTEISEMTAESLAVLVTQSGLFGQAAFLLDFDAAFKGQAGVKPRNAVIKLLQETSLDALVVIIDLNASASRQKTYKALGEHQHHPSPRFNALIHWIRQELEAEKLSFHPDVPETLADLFGEDLPNLAAEIQKLSVLAEDLSSERVRFLVNRPAARDAFGLIEAIAKGEVTQALTICQNLLAQGEAPPRILGALLWQFNLVARCVGLRETRAKLDPGLISQTLKIKPFVAKKALAIAKKLDESGLKRVLECILDADEAMKTGKDDTWALTEMTLKLARLFEKVSS